MKASTLLILSLFALSGHASWFGGEKPEYDNWDTQQLHHWLESNGINVPEHYSKSSLRELVAVNWDAHKPWTQSMYEAAQKHFEGVQASAFDTWDESRLRNFLLEQGVVEPKGPREKLVLEAKKRYNSYTAAASSLSAQASASASTAVYGDTKYQASKSASSASSIASKSASSASSVASNSASSLASHASQTASASAAWASGVVDRKLQDSKDYVYSTWDDSQLRTFLEKKGVVKPKEKTTREQLLSKMRDSYNAATDPVYNSWSESYMKEWLVSHGIIKSEEEKKRDYYLDQLKHYYYAPQDKAWSTWSDSETKAWLVHNGYIKSDAQVQREKMQKMVEANWYNAKDTTWSAWDDSSMRNWLIEKGYLRTDAQVKRDELIKLMNDKYTDMSSKTAAYLTWPDARLRGYLRAHGVNEAALPRTRTGLLQETRIRWYEANTRVEMLIQKIRDSVYAGVENAEAKLSQRKLAGRKRSCEVVHPAHPAQKVVEEDF
ncbi:hypothetical protein FRC03_011131 [Tulasnella sp. 419]|nr:hypothetical protein FRC03_011131 [Tulasnella sp. 419]